jgi:putative ABC transport system permease protein
VGLGIAFILLTATAKALILVTRKFTPALPFAWRQGLSNLHRPNNRTLLLLLSLGLGTFLIVSVYLVQQTLLTQLVSTGGGKDQANAILFDIQSDQREGVTNLVLSLNFPVLDEAPIITMRISALNGKPVEAILTNKQNNISRWSLRHEYRSTFNDHLRDGEKITAGQWVSQVSSETKVIPISLEEGVARDLHLGLNDEITFDVQGVPLTTRVASLRQVEWRRIQPNFFVIFPRGVLDDAPAMDILVTRVPSAEDSARLQREVVRRFPNVSFIDLRLILQTVNSIIDKISFVVRFMAMFTVITGLLVLVGALLTGRYQRIQESTLLRTLGASRGQIFRILFAEYFALGLLGALTGIILAVAAAWALSSFVFHMRFVPRLAPLIIALVAVPTLTVLTGLLMSRGVLNQPPLAILRSET